MLSPCRAGADRRVRRLGVALLAAALVGAACGGDDTGAGALGPATDDSNETVAAGEVPSAPPAWLIERAGDATTTFEVSDRSYNLSARNLGLSARIRFA